ncbi:MAG: PAS domain S-box protein [Chloroflexales bacterium]|nr:PAS domain S-box protein [Chloroflexales bacterium]
MAALDFTMKATVGASGTTIDTVAIGINLLSEELAASMVSRTYVDNILESMLDALVVTDQRGAITTVNRAAAQLFGYAREDLLGRPIAALFTHAEAIERVLDLLRSGTESAIAETICRTGDGRTFPASVSASAMQRSSYEPQGSVCTIRDLTERRQAEEALRRSIAQEETIRAQDLALLELSTPLIPISDHVVVMPLIGSIDTRRAQLMIETLLQGISSTGARIAILDITGVPLVDTQVANTFIHAAQAVQLLGAKVMLTGIRPEVAQTLIGLGIDLSSIMTCSTLQSGIAAVLRHR